MTTADHAAPATPQLTRGPHLAWLWLGLAVAVLAAGWAGSLSQTP